MMLTVESVPRLNEQRDGEVLVESYPVIISTGEPFLNDTQLSLVRELNQNEALRKSASSRMRNNSEKIPLDKSIIGTDQPRPLSAYFFLMGTSTEVIIEAGLVASDGIASIHNEMHNIQGHKERESQSRLEVSGHIMDLPDLNVTLALFDRYFDISRATVDMEELIKALTESERNFICLGAEGQPLYK